MDWLCKEDKHPHVHLQTQQGNTDFPREFMTWHLNHHQGTVLEMSKELP